MFQYKQMLKIQSIELALVEKNKLYQQLMK